MKETFAIARANFTISASPPIRITSSCEISSGEVMAQSLLIWTDAAGQIKTRSKGVQVSCIPPDYEWTTMAATSASEMVTSEWLLALAETNDPLWQQYVRQKEPSWKEAELPAQEILRFAIWSNENVLNILAAFRDKLPRGAAKDALKQAVEVGVQVKVRTI